MEMISSPHRPTRLPGAAFLFGLALLAGGTGIYSCPDVDGSQSGGEMSSLR